MRKPVRNQRRAQPAVPRRGCGRQRGIGSSKVKGQPDYLRGNRLIIGKKHNVDWLGRNLALNRQTAVPVYRFGKERDYLLVWRESRSFGRSVGTEPNCKQHYEQEYIASRIPALDRSWCIRGLQVRSLISSAKAIGAAGHADAALEQAPFCGGHNQRVRADAETG
jgi:hypothetical protein